MRSVSQQRPYQQVAAKIRQRIVETPYRPGGRLPPEREMAGMLNVSRTVVREALIMLEIEGLIEVRREPVFTSQRTTLHAVLVLSQRCRPV